jgi:hypothetical protein
VDACTNSELRTATAKKGFAYAMALGDEKRLHQDVFEAIVELCGAGD